MRRDDVAAYGDRKHHPSYLPSFFAIPHLKAPFLSLLKGGRESFGMLPLAIQGSAEKWPLQVLYNTKPTARPCP